MPIEQIVQLLTAERDRLDRAIRALQGAGKRRGAARPAAAPVAKKRRRGRMSAAARKAQAERMRAYWAAKRKQKTK